MLSNVRNSLDKMTFTVTFEISSDFQAKQNDQLARQNEKAMEAAITAFGGAALLTQGAFAVATLDGVVCTCIGTALVGWGSKILLNNYNEAMIAMNSREIIREPLEYMNLDLKNLFSPTHQPKIHTQKLRNQLTKNTLFAREKIDREVNELSSSFFKTPFIDLKMNQLQEKVRDQLGFLSTYFSQKS